MATCPASFSESGPLTSSTSASRVVRKASESSERFTSVRWRVLRQKMKEVMVESAIRTRASTAVYQSVSRTRTESSMVLPDWRCGLGAMARRNAIVPCVCGVRIGQRAKEVAGAAAGMEQWPSGIRVDFTAHAIHVNLNQIREGIESFVPNVLGDFRASHNPTGVARKIFEQRIFLGGKGHVPAGPGDALRRCVQEEVGNGNFGRTELAGTAQQRAEAREQLPEFKRLGEVIVSAMIEAGDAVFHGVARGQHQNGHALPRFSEFAANLKTVAAGNHHIEDYQVVGSDRRLIKRVVAAVGDIHGVGLFAQALGHESRDARIVFN